MIQIEKSNGRLSILSTVSDICDSISYCEYKIPLFTQGIKPPPTEATQEGSKAHQKQAQYEKDHFNLMPVTKEELADISKDIEFPYETINTRLIVPLTLTKYSKANMLLYGRADKVYRSQETLTVEDTKYPIEATQYLENLEPFPDQKLQALLYLNSTFSNDATPNSKTWFSIPHKKKAWIINIKDRNNGETIKTFRGLQTNELEEYMRYNLERFASIAAGEIQPQHHQNPLKCLKCRIPSCQHNIKKNITADL